MTLSEESVKTCLNIVPYGTYVDENTFKEMYLTYYNNGKIDAINWISNLHNINILTRYISFEYKMCNIVKERDQNILLTKETFDCLYDAAYHNGFLDAILELINKKGDNK